MQVAESLEKGLTEDIEKGLVSLDSRQKEITDFFRQLTSGMCLQQDQYGLLDLTNK
jgi:hypothetical protein